MWILVGLLISVGFSLFCGKLLSWCGRNDYKILEESEDR